MCKTISDSMLSDPLCLNTEIRNKSGKKITLAAAVVDIEHDDLPNKYRVKSLSIDHFESYGFKAVTEPYFVWDNPKDIKRIGA